MLKKAIKTILKITTITVLVLILAGIVFYCLGNKAGGDYVNDYNEYYLYKKECYSISPLQFPGSGAYQYYKVWFLPGQKRKLLDKIKEDVNIELENVIANNSEILKSYEISDDFKKIYIYLNENADIPFGFGSNMTVEERVVLYHQLILGIGRIELRSIINYIQVE